MFSAVQWKHEFFIDMVYHKKKWYKINYFVVNDMFKFYLVLTFSRLILIVNMTKNYGCFLSFSSYISLVST